MRRDDVGLAVIFAALALAGCGFTEGPGALIVDPSRYDGYHCNELTTQLKSLVAREKELRGLMDRAEESGSAVIGTLTYRTDYEVVLNDEKVLQRAAVEKKCPWTQPSQSDQSIR
jgi:hypothetical protein